MVYRLIVTSRIMDDGSHGNRVDDYIDPEFESIDRGVAGRTTTKPQLARGDEAWTTNSSSPVPFWDRASPDARWRRSQLVRPGGDDHGE